MYTNRKSVGFTIVELLIVVVVIAILAAITIIAYNGIQQRATNSAMQSSLSSFGKKIEQSKISGGTSSYPASLADAGVTTDPGTTYSYYFNNDGANTNFCLVARKGTQKYSVQSTNLSPQEGECKGYNYALNGSAESDTTRWSANAGAALQQSSVRASEGSRSILITDLGTFGDSYVAYTLPNTPVGDWTFTADVYLTSAGSTDYSRGVWLNGAPSFTTYWSTAYNQTTMLNTWQSFSRNVTITAEADNFIARFYVMTGYDIYVDNVRLTRQ